MRVVVVGAGFAGLMAAWRLARAIRRPGGLRRAHGDDVGMSAGRLPAAVAADATASRPQTS